ncbi:hypothetical protein FACS189447_08140 [Spirochaetia bacterium]|nr:hypothetical protein FACS189447_08140 [Spirochaetia bacterium]
MKLSDIVRKDFTQLIFVFFSFALMVAVSYFFVSSIVEKQIAYNAKGTLNTAEAMIRSDLMEAEVALLNAELFIQKGLEREESMEDLERYLTWQTSILSPEGARVPGLVTLFAYIDGVFLHGSNWIPPADYEPEHRIWYTTAKEAGSEIGFTVPYIHAYSGKTTITMTKMLQNDKGEDIGVVALDLDFSIISDFILSLESSNGGYGMLVDENLAFIVHPSSQYLGKPLEGISSGHSKVAQELKHGDPEKIPMESAVNTQGIQVMVIFKPLYNGWNLGMAIPVKNYYHDVRSMALTLSIMGTVSMVILSFFLIQLSILKARSDEENKEKSSFLARMSHEIRTPMNSILGMAELIQRKAVSGEVQEYVDIIQQSGVTLMAIINDILDISKIETGKFQIEKRNYYVASVINDVINVIRPRVAEKSLEFIVNLDSAIPAQLIGDDVRLRQVLTNLLSNAVKYTRKGFISLDVAEERLDNYSLKFIITVEDSGLGIKPEDMGRLFGEFSRVDAEANRGVEGTGLGLTITRALCRAMGGDVTVSSEYERGSVFQATLIQEFEYGKPAARVVDPRQKRVLFYDWRYKYIQSFTKVFKNLGVKAECSADFSEFLQSLEQGGYNYAFISSKYAVEAISTLGKQNTPLQLIIIGELGESSFYREVSNIMMPVYSINLASILNDESEMIPSRNTKLNIHFTAPQVKVLIVDDINTNLRVAKELMAPYNMNIDTCLSGAESIDLVKNHRYDLVFMDHMMPGMDGIEAVAFIRSLDPNDAYYQKLPIIALTANAISGQREMFLQNGINDLLTKPINIQKLNDLLEKWIPPEKRISYSQSWEKDSAPVPEIVIAGVDTEKGLHNTGDSETAYLDILADFCRDIETQTVKINGALGTGNIKLYITLVHALKGAARSIGAMETGEAASWLEKNAEKEDRSIIRNKTADLLKSLQILTDTIRSVVEQKISGKGKENKDVSSLHLDALKIALDEMDIEAVNRMFMEYTKLSLDKKTRDLVAELEQHILMFEYDEAIEKIDQAL